ncbi:hypothetical protein, partial [Enterobacter hormaechei]|uniref:hypothetical protein n=1 Tax=Enterobacter hormaechei TaxID=158836 RepID=UPI001F1BE2BB
MTADIASASSESEKQAGINPAGAFARLALPLKIIMLPVCCCRYVQIIHPNKNGNDNYLLYYAQVIL